MDSPCPQREQQHNGINFIACVIEGTLLFLCVAIQKEDQQKKKKTIDIVKGGGAEHSVNGIAKEMDTMESADRHEFYVP